MTSETLKGLFKEYFEIGALSEADQAKYRLICRYEDRVSHRFKDARLALQKKGKEAFSNELQDIMSRPTLAFKRLSKWQGTQNPYYMLVCVGTYGLAYYDSMCNTVPSTKDVSKRLKESDMTDSNDTPTTTAPTTPPAAAPTAANSSSTPSTLSTVESKLAPLLTALEDFFAQRDSLSLAVGIGIGYFGHGVLKFAFDTALFLVKAVFKI